MRKRELLLFIGSAPGRIPFCFILIPLLLINCTLIIKSITNKNEVPDIGGIFPMVILTDSMNPQLASGDLVICRKVNAKNIKTGDVISLL